MKNKQPKKEEKPREPKPQEVLVQEFLVKYNELCKEYGYQINTNPAFKLRDDGTWSIVLQSGVGLLPKDN